MKKIWRILSLALVVAMLFSVTALGAGTESEKATITVKGAGVKATFADNEDIINVTVTGTNLTVGSQYVVLMVKGTETDYTIQDGSILYIDQTAAVAGEKDGEGKITFQVYPSSIESSVILIAGAGVNGETGPLVAAIVKGKYILGDVNGNGKVDVGDAMLLLQYVAGLVDKTQLDLQAADVNHTDSVNVGDAMKLLQFVANLTTLD